MRTYLDDSVYVEHFSHHLQVTQDGFDELWNVFNIIPSTPNPMNRNFIIKRKQCTYGAEYSFAGQKSQNISNNLDEYPYIIKKVLDDVNKFSNSDLYNVVHVNFYPDGSAGLDPHSDNEAPMLKDYPIYSYTLLSEQGNPRGFQVYDMNKVLLNEFFLDHGDLLIMSGGMQRKYKHGIKKSMAKKFQCLKRINLTVRAWDPCA